MPISSGAVRVLIEGLMVTWSSMFGAIIGMSRWRFDAHVGQPVVLSLRLFWHNQDTNTARYFRTLSMDKKC